MKARQENIDAQQDSDEFHGHLFEGIRASFGDVSYDPSLLTRDQRVKLRLTLAQE